MSTNIVVPPVKLSDLRRLLKTLDVAAKSGGDEIVHLSFSSDHIAAELGNDEGRHLGAWVKNTHPNKPQLPSS